jgi:hydroxymethylpyrimidine/phosphomethylpyrimidine kinase
VNEGTRRVALSIGGSDSGGGAGIQADLKTFAAFGCFGTSVVTAVTAQNTLGVRAVHLVPRSIIATQIDALAEDVPPDAFKIGMLGGEDAVTTVAERVSARGWRNLVLDPVIAAGTGEPLLTEAGVSALRERLLQLAVCVTPNLDEAERLTGRTVRTPDAMVDAGFALLDRGARTVLVKGGHLDSDILVDVLVTADGTERFTRTRLATTSTHGTGCTLSAAITAGLALRRPIDEAVRTAINYVQSALRAAPRLGRGSGPLWHGVEPRTDR